MVRLAGHVGACGVEGMVALMDTTWQGRYDDLERFAALAGGRR